MASSESVGWHSWWLEDSTGLKELPSRLKGWDYATPIRIQTSITVNSNDFVASTGLGPESELILAIVAESPDTGERLISKTPFYVSGSRDNTSVNGRLDISGGRVAGTLRLYALIVLGASSTSPSDPRVAIEPGSRLAQSPMQTLALEDSSGRFPTEAIDFREIGFPQAPWTLLTTFDDLRDNFMSTVRLLINSSSPVGQAALDPERSVKIADAMRADIVRILVSQISSQFEIGALDVFQEDSVGFVAESMTLNLLGQSLRSTCGQYRDNPARFELLLADRVNPWQSVVME
ncbi:hypothetical protein [Gordonia paraffinivorans]|uniref:hypothetical protein n=1 Tax=Gordonia paraffinivorans TaxID=175628 RepID=UPI0011B1FF1B|nr:hypothetical protein [Gordonia paraffinivorans]